MEKKREKEQTVDMVIDGSRQPGSEERLLHGEALQCPLIHIWYTSFWDLCLINIINTCYNFKMLRTKLLINKHLT